MVFENIKFRHEIFDIVLQKLEVNDYNRRDNCQRTDSKLFIVLKSDFIKTGFVFMADCFEKTVFENI